MLGHMQKTARTPLRDATAQTVAANLSAELSRQRWSARKASVALGLTHVYVSRRASGDVECSASDLAMFAELLEVPITKFFEGTQKAPAAISDEGQRFVENAAKVRTSD